jgi:hypothetical protein
MRGQAALASWAAVLFLCWHRLASVGIQGALARVSAKTAVVPRGRLEWCSDCWCRWCVAQVASSCMATPRPAARQTQPRNWPGSHSATPLPLPIVCVCRRLQSCLGHMTCCLLQHLPALGHRAPFEPQPCVAVPCPLLLKPWTDSKARAPPPGAEWCGVDMSWRAPVTRHCHPPCDDGMHQFLAQQCASSVCDPAPTLVAGCTRLSSCMPSP